MSLRYLTTNFSAINQFTGFVEFLPEIWVSYSVVFGDIDFASEKIFQSILKIEKIVGVIEQINFTLVKIHT